MKANRPKSNLFENGWLLSLWNIVHLPIKCFLIWPIAKKMTKGKNAQPR
jgi:hypothetical protein